MNIINRTLLHLQDTLIQIFL